MHTETVTYKDLDGNPVTDTFSFHMTRVETLEFVAKYKGNPLEVLIKASENMREGNNADENEAVILKFFRDAVGGSVGKRSSNGKSFIKDQETRDELMCSEAYSEFFMALMSDHKRGADFIKNLFPDDIVRESEIQSVQKNHTHAELLSMSDNEFAKVVGDDIQKMTKEQLMIAMQRKNQKAA